MDELNSLIERIEKAEAGSRDLNIKIAQVVGAPVRDYTRSIDGAMTLVPDGWPWVHVSNCADGAWRCILANSKAETVSALAETEALARCAAALRARQDTTTIEGDG